MIARTSTTPQAHRWLTQIGFFVATAEKCDEMTRRLFSLLSKLVTSLLTMIDKSRVTEVLEVVHGFHVRTAFSDVCVGVSTSETKLQVAFPPRGSFSLFLCCG